MRKSHSQARCWLSRERSWRCTCSANRATELQPTCLVCLKNLYMFYGINSNRHLQHKSVTCACLKILLGDLSTP